MLCAKFILLTGSCLHFDNNCNRLILDADNVPIVLPFVHTGMQDIMPIGAKLPRIGKTVSTFLFHQVVLFILESGDSFKAAS